MRLGWLALLLILGCAASKPKSTPTPGPRTVNYPRPKLATSLHPSGKAWLDSHTPRSLKPRAKP